jgi:cytoskeletal protein RodZ
LGKIRIPPIAVTVMTEMSERFDSLGDLLRTARERRGLTVQELAAITRIPRRHLDALERGQFDELPGGMYRRAELRTYAETVGLDKAFVLERLEQSLGLAADPVPGTAAAPIYDPSPRSRIYAVVVTLGLIAAAGTTYWWWRQPVLVADPTEAALATALVVPASAAVPDAGVEAPSRDVTSTSHIAAPGPQPAGVGDAVLTPANVTSAETIVPVVNDLALTVTSAPPGARVLVDGIGYGPTPITIRHLRPGQKRVRLVLDGYVSVEQRLRLTPTRPATLDVTLDRSR